MQDKNAQELARYLASHLQSLKSMAQAHDLGLLAYLLEMAVLEAREESQRDSP